MSIRKSNRIALPATSRRNNGAAFSMAQLDTLNGERLLVDEHDPVFDAGRSMFSQHSLGSVLFLGDTGCGKTRRAEALTIPENFRVLLQGTKLENIEVDIRIIEVDLIPITANAELNYDCCLEDGTFTREPAMVTEFIIREGTTDRAKFEEIQRANRDVLHSGKGCYRMWVLMADDFDRTYVEIQNGFMKRIHGTRHVIQKLRHPQVFLRLQCIGTSNSTLGAPSGKYSAAAGRLDLAVANRFQVYHLDDPDFFAILASYFPQEEEFCEIIVDIVNTVKTKQKDGEFQGLGEISLRQIFPLVEGKARYGFSNEAAAARLFSTLPRDGDERSQANVILGNFFGRHIRRENGDFSF